MGEVLHNSYHDINWFRDVFTSNWLNSHKSVVDLLIKARNNEDYYGADFTEAYYYLGYDYIRYVIAAPDGGIQTYQGIKDVIYNNVFKSSCKITRIDIGDSRHTDGHLVVTYRLQYNNIDSDNHRLVEKILKKDQEQQNRVYICENKPVNYSDLMTADKIHDVYTEIGNKLVDLYQNNDEKTFVNIVYGLKRSFNIRFPSFRIGDWISKDAVKSAVDIDIYKKLENELLIIKYSIMEDDTMMYFASNRLSKNPKYKAYTVVFGEKNLEENYNGWNK